MIDASVALKWFLPEPGSAAAERILQAFLSDALTLFAPDLLLIEAASALWRRSVVHKELTNEDVRSIYRDLLTLPLNYQPSDRIAAAAFSLALTHRQSVYDSTYFALAMEMGCEFITADRLLVAELSHDLPFIKHLSEIRL